MVRNLKAAETAGRLTNKLGTYLRPGVLVVDEVGYQPLERAEANLVFQVISKRYEKGSIILTSNKTFSEWGQVFGDEVLATAILDRLLHHCEVISINGPSYRLKNRLKAIERENDVAQEDPAVGRDSPSCLRRASSPGPGPPGCPSPRAAAPGCPDTSRHR